MKYFVLSDLHSFTSETKRALKKEGFNPNSKSHTLIVNGDIWDRGTESQEMKDFLDSVENKVMILGNHEWLLLELINRGHFTATDLYNGVIDTVIQLAGGYDQFPEFRGASRAKSYFKVRDFNSLSHLDKQISIVNKLKKTGIVEWIVSNFFDHDVDGNREVKWDDNKEHFTIVGKPRHYFQVGDRLITHGFFPSPDWMASIKVDGVSKPGKLPEDFDLLDDASVEMWLEHDCGVWSRTPYWLDMYHSCKLIDLYKYLQRRNINHIYIGHWNRVDLEHVGTAVSIMLNENYYKYCENKPKIYYLDDSVVTSGNVIVKTFTIR